MSIEILSEINNNYRNATEFHLEQADLFFFIYLAGYGQLHQYQYCTESMTQRKLKRYITTTYDVNVPDKLPTSDSSIVQLTKGLNRNKIDENQIRNIVCIAWEKYVQWESQTLKLYEQCAMRLLDEGSVSAFNFVGNLITEVKQELIYIKDKFVELNAHGFDMPQIVSEQSDYYERYIYLAKKLHKNYEEFHHFNSALTAADRGMELKK